MKTYLENLRESNDFLNLLLDNINSAVLVSDENLQIHQFNDAFLNLFDSAQKSETDRSFGRVTGCVNSVRENKRCGETSQCGTCILRRSLIKTLTENAPVDRVRLERVFYIDGEPTQKYLEFSARPIDFQGRKMILVIIYDITDIERQKLEMERKQNQLDHDLVAASEIQKSLLPNHLPNIENLDISWRFEPCEQIGGDIFNIHPLDNTQIGLYMADVCGHGVPAALISVAVSQFFQTRYNLITDDSKILSPEVILNNLDKAFPFDRFESFFSVIYMNIDHSRGRLQYSNAGHPAPVLMRADGRLEFLDHHGPIIGSDSGKPFGRQEKQLHPGDTVLLYTDGLLESRNDKQGFYGKERLHDLIRQNRDATSQELVETLYDDIRSYEKALKPADDISIMAVRFH